MTKRSRFLNGVQGAGTRKRAFWLLPLLLLLFSLAPRLVAVGRYVTPDEPTWVYRSIQFREAILAGDWAGTLVAGHPGVTTAWLGALGASVQLIVNPELREVYDWLTRLAFLTPDNVEAYKRLAVFLTGGRLAVALVNSLGVVGIYYLARRLWGERAAAIAGILLAFDPFLAGLSGLLHVDGLSATFATLSLLALASGIRRPVTDQPNHHPGRWLAFSGAAAGLAVLSKTPTLVLLPVTGLVYVYLFFRDRDRRLRERIIDLLKLTLVWGVAFGLVIVVLFPALWISPTGVLSTITGSANRHLEEALRPTYFLGKIAYNHGPLFYPVALLWRLSPVVWLAIPAIIWLARKRRRDGLLFGSDNSSVLILAVWAMLFLVAINPAAKKFDRYILPAVPSLIVLSAVGWGSVTSSRRAVSNWLVAGVVLAQVIFWGFFAAYPLTAYNPLVGGPTMAARVLPIGWGEGISAAGTYLSSSSPEVSHRRAISGIAPSLAPFFAGHTLVDGWDDAATADYRIVTLGGRQLDPAGFTAQIGGGELIHTEHFGGLDQAWVYRFASPQPPAEPPDLPEIVTFGNQMALTSYDQVVVEDTVTISATWLAMGAVDPDGRYTLRIVISDSQGNAWATQETDLLNEVYFFPPDWLSAETGVVRYYLELPPGIPAAPYTTTLALIDSRTGGQMPVRVGDGAFQGVAFEAGKFDVSPPPAIVSASRVQIANDDGTTWLDGQLQLLGFGDITDEALAGSRLPVDLFWHVPTGSLPGGMLLNWHLLAADGEDRVIVTESLSRFDTGLWRTGETIQEKYQVPLPPDLPPGRYGLAMEPRLVDGELAGGPALLAGIRINNFDRSYALPDDVPVRVIIDWEPLTLLGMGPDSMIAGPGGIIDLVLYWRKNGTHGDVYSIFLHVVDPDGNIVLQADHWPGGLPTDILDDGQIMIDRVPLSLPPDLPAGTYEIRVGLYAAEDGQRLPIINGQFNQQDLSGSDTLALPVRLQVTAP